MSLRFADAFRAEWIKARSIASTGWLLAAAVALGVGLSAAICAVVHDLGGGGQHPAKLALAGIELAQAVVAIWAVRAISGEYRSGMIRTTLTAVPQRANLLAAKTAVVAAVALAAGAVTVAGCLLVATANGLPLSLRAAIGSILFLGLIGLLAAGTALAVRDAAAATAIVLSLLYLFPLATQLAGNAGWQRHLEQIGPTTGGLAVLAAWAAGSILIGGLALHVRDS